MQVKSTSLYYSSPLTILNLSISHFTPFLFIYLYNFHLFVLLFFLLTYISFFAHIDYYICCYIPPLLFPIFYFIYMPPLPSLSFCFLSPPFSKRKKERLQYTSACVSKINLCVLFFIISTYIFHHFYSLATLFFQLFYLLFLFQSLFFFLSHVVHALSLL